MFSPRLAKACRRFFLPAVSLAFLHALPAADWSGDYDPPAAYYAPAEGLFGENLRDALHGIIAPHTVLTYTDVATAIRVLDQDPDNPENILLIYSGFSVGAFSNWVEWNREHVWPRSYGALGDRSGSRETHSVHYPAFSDFHHMYPCNPQVNEDRSNYSFDWLPSGNSVPNAPGSKVDSSRNLFEPPDMDKGRAARIMLYMDVRYDGGEWEAAGGNGTPNLVLGTIRDRNTPGINRFGNLPALLEWNRMFPPDLRERRRNHLVHNGVQAGNRLLIQGNRNPFIDYPELADALFTAADYRSWFSWKAANFPMEVWRDEERTHPLVAAGDSRIPLLVEFSQDLAPGTGNADNLPAVARRFGGRVTDIHFTELREHALSGVAYIVEHSETPLTEASWARYDYSGAHVSVTASDGFSRRLRVSDGGLPNPERRRHFRLRVNMDYPVDDPTGVVFDPVGSFNDSGSIFAYFETDGEGRRETDWWGMVDDTAYPWVDHETHGTVWIAAEDEEAVWVYDPVMGWLHTGRLIGPHYYSAARGTWFTHIEPTAEPQRWFFDWSETAFVSEHELRSATISLTDNH